MPELTLDQADKLADDALDLRSAVSNFLLQHFDTLTAAQRDGLRTLDIALGDLVDHLTAVAIHLTLSELQETLNHLSSVTTGVNKAADHLDDVRKVLNVATALVGLGTAIAAGNPGAVLNAVRETVRSVQTG